jgi:hypothetical protein
VPVVWLLSKAFNWTRRLSGGELLDIMQLLGFNVPL